MLLKQGFEIVFEHHHDLFRFGLRVELRIGGHVVKKDQRGLAKLLDDPLPRQLAFHITAVGPHCSRRKEYFGLPRQRLQQLLFQRRFQLDQFFRQRFHGGAQVAFGLIQRLEQGWRRQRGFHRPFDQPRKNLADIGVMLHQLGNDDPDVVDGQLAHEVGEQEHELSVGFLAVFNHPFEHRPECLVLLFETAGLGFELPYFQAKLIPCALNIFHRGRSRYLCLCHNRNVP